MNIQDDLCQVVPVKLKWGKQILTDPQLVIKPGSTTSNALKERISVLTGVPQHRQKLLAKGAWKGMLRDGIHFDKSIASGVLIITLIGSAEAPPAATQKHRFVEDLTPEEIAAAEASKAQEALKLSEGMIIPLQKPPILRQEDKQRKEVYAYNRLVTGLPQYQIEELLRQRDNIKPHLKGTIAMTLGMELRRAYITALEVLPQDGTLLSAADDGHVMGWRHGERVLDVVHQGYEARCVDCLAVFPEEGPQQLAFCTGGSSFLRFWSSEGNCVQAVACPPGTTPNAIVPVKIHGQDSTFLATSFRITRRVDPNQFRLLPQDAAGRQRRAVAQMQEVMIQENLARIAQSVQLWYSTTTQPGLQSITLQPLNQAAPVHSLAVVSHKAADEAVARSYLVCGDSVGGLRFWSPTERSGSHLGETASVAHSWESEKIFQICPPESNKVASVVCMEAIPNQSILAVSTKEQAATEPNHRLLREATHLTVKTSQAIFLLDWNRGFVSAVLNGHRDCVICMTSLPDGSLATGGDKMDATLKVWEQSQWLTQASDEDEHQKQHQNNSEATALTEASSNLSEVGYTFALAVLPDTKEGSQKYALAAARYNVVKICL